MDTEEKVIELSAERSIAAGSGVSIQGLVQEFLDWQVTSRVVDAIVIAAAGGGLLARVFQRKEADRYIPQVIDGQSVSRQHYGLLERAAVSGFRLIVLSNSTDDELKKFFEVRGYDEQSGTNRGRILHSAWNTQALSEALSVASKIGEGNICLFAHDADPVYILQSRHL